MNVFIGTHNGDTQNQLSTSEMWILNYAQPNGLRVCNVHKTD